MAAGTVALRCFAARQDYKQGRVNVLTGDRRFVKKCRKINGANTKQKACQVASAQIDKGAGMIRKEGGAGKHMARVIPSTDPCTQYQATERYRGLPQGLRYRARPWSCGLASDSRGAYGAAHAPGAAGWAAQGTW